MSPDLATVVQFAPQRSVLSPRGNLRTQLGLGPAPARRALILEDDPAFRDVMQCFLTDNNFDVVAVQNGMDGVHEVLARDFDIILCDLLMPTLPGDMFYRAVERMRPHLCDKFVFMTGNRGYSNVDGFISATKGVVLSKPFHVADLLELIAFIELRGLLMAA